VTWGEIDLNGQIRPVASHDIRLKLAARLGYAPVLHPGEVKNIAVLQTRLFGRGKEGGS
jgi:DNA repair protein RadA/Sms